MRILWKILLALVVLLIAGGVYLYFAHAWVFFVKPGPGGEDLGLELTIVAGNGEPGFADGKGSAARLDKPIRLSPLGPESVVFADINNHAIRIAHADGRVETIAGGPGKEGHQDGPGSVARFESPHGVAVRGDGAIAVCEAKGCVVRLIVREGQTWTVSTLAGVPGEGGSRDGPAADALFDAPHAVAWGPQGELYVADLGGGAIREIRNGQVTTVVDEGLKWPMDIALAPDGALWIADAGRVEIRRWHPNEGLSEPLLDHELAMPHGIAVMPSGHLAVAEMYGHRILRIDPETRELATYCTGLNKPAAVLAHGGRLWIADLYNHRLVTIPIP
jgi:streptogramin lyase